VSPAQLPLSHSMSALEAQPIPPGILIDWDFLCSPRGRGVRSKSASRRYRSLMDG
jgi:hypothetical protein